MNLLITTLGTSWPIVPELIAFTNPIQVPLFQNHPDATLHQQWRNRHLIERVDEVWVITTESKQTLPTLEKLREWQTLSQRLPTIRVFKPLNVADLGSLDECERMRELIYRLVLKGREFTQQKQSKLYLSLAGGRKTMSADMFTAADHFGCDALLHVVDLGSLPEVYHRCTQPELFINALPEETAQQLSPIVVHGEKGGNHVFQIEASGINSENYPVHITGKESSIENSPDLVRKIEEILAQAADLHINFTRKLIECDQLSNFHALYSLPPKTIQRLQQTRLGKDPLRKDAELKWLSRLPKTELHCHMGGLLDASAILGIANAHRAKIEQCAADNDDFKQWLKTIQASRQPASIESLRKDYFPWKQFRDRFGPEKRHICTSAFILFALQTAERIDQFIYSDLLDPGSFRQIGIEHYEALGDLQGSSLLQSEEALRAVARYLTRYCEQENILYCELRCSPYNCTLAGLSVQRVIDILTGELSSSRLTRFKLIFIASRHGKLSRIIQHVELAQEIKTNQPDFFHRWIAGFDLAGAENAQSPKGLRSHFHPIMEDCIHITIHAGEGESAQNIWEAVYELNADRIGHGLTLYENEDLLKRLANRRIGIEMCPSSNDQIVGFRSQEDDSHKWPLYPLREYLHRGLRVSINTDDPGISRTTLSHEYMKASEMSQNGLSMWNVYQLIRNGFQTAFLPPDEKKKLLIRAEKRIIDSITHA